MVQVLDGSSLITIEDKSFNLHAGDMIILPPNIPHAVHANGPFCMLLTIIKE